jgi:hypothetical protein
MQVENAFALSHRLTALEQRGRHLRDELSSRQVLTDPAELKLDSTGDNKLSFPISFWFEQSKSTLAQIFVNDSNSFNTEISRISDLSTSRSPLDTINETLELLSIAQNWIVPEAQDELSASLKRLVEESLKEGYFKSWPFRGVVGAASFLVIIFFGGTLYSTWQVKSVLEQSEITKRQIETARTDVEVAEGTVLDKIKQEIDAAASVEKGKLTSALSQIQTDATSDAAEQTKTFRETLTKARDQHIIDLDKTTNEVRESILMKANTSQLTDALKNNADMATRAIDAQKSTVTSEAATAISLIGKSQNEAQAAAEKFKTDFDLERAKWPNQLTEATTEVKTFNDIVSKYSGPINGLLSRISGENDLASLQALFSTLGNAIWILLFSTLLSLTAIVMSIIALRSR